MTHGDRSTSPPGVVRCPAAVGLLLVLLLPAARFEAAAGAGDTVSLTFGGDVSFGRYRRQEWVASGSEDSFRPVAPLFASADLAFVNLESPLSRETPRDIRASRRYARSGVRLRAPVEMAGVLARAGIDVVSLANNHAEDGLRDALADTLAALSAVDVAVAGVSLDGDPSDAVVRRVPGAAVHAFAATSTRNLPLPGPPLVSFMERRRLRTVLADRVRAVRRADPGAVIFVSLHWGVEKASVHDPQQTVTARRLIDAGANLVVGHHPHVLQPIELYRGGVILYSLGNLLFDFEANVLRRSAIVRVVLRRDGAPSGGWLPAELTVFPVWMGDATAAIRPATGAEANRILESLRQRSAVHAGTALTVEGEALVWRAAAGARERPARVPLLRDLASGLLRWLRRAG